MTKLLSVLILSLAIILPESATPFDDQLKAAKQGDAEAQLDIGHAYFRVENDYVEAVSWYFKAAEQGNSDAQIALGDCFASGIGEDKNYTESVIWYRKSAEQGNATAQGRLGYMYDYGKGVNQDYALSFAWYRKSADGGNFFTLAILGDACFKGQGVMQDYIQAHKWYNLAAARTPASFAEEINYALHERNRVAALMTTDQIAEAQKLAREWNQTR